MAFNLNTDTVKLYLAGPFSVGTLCSGSVSPDIATLDGKEEV